MEDKKKEKVEKSPVLYIIMFSIWTVLAVFLWYFFIKGMIELKFLDGATPSKAKYIIAEIIIGLNGLFITYFWLNGVKDFIYVIWFYMFKGKIYKRYSAAIDEDTSLANDKVLFLYCTCNDFDGTSLEACLHQDYQNYKTVILDDSSNENTKMKLMNLPKSTISKLLEEPIVLALKLVISITIYFETM